MRNRERTTPTGRWALRVTRKDDQAARTSVFRQLLHTHIRRFCPSTRTARLVTFSSNLRFVFFFENVLLWPNIGPLLQMLHFAMRHHPCVSLVKRAGCYHTQRVPSTKFVPVCLGG